MPTTGVRMVGVYFPANGKFYAVGGRSMDGTGNDFAHPFEYNPSSNSWTIKSATFSDNQVSNMACGVLTDSGTPYIYCVGGSAGGQTTATDRMFRYDPVADTIESIAAPWAGDSDGITLPGGFAVFNNKFYILGGFSDQHSDDQPDLGVHSHHQRVGAEERRVASSARLSTDRDLWCLYLHRGRKRLERHYACRYQAILFNTTR